MIERYIEIMLDIFVSVGALRLVHRLLSQPHRPQLAMERGLAIELYYYSKRPLWVVHPSNLRFTWPVGRLETL